MHITIPDPHPGRCLNHRFVWGESYRCLGYENEEHVCSFAIPAKDPRIGSGSKVYGSASSMGVIPKPWVKPDDSGTSPESTTNEGPEMQVIVTRDVGPDEVRWLKRVYKTGERLWTFHGVTYGCVDESAGAALSEQRGEYPFFQFPYDAFKLVADASSKSTESATGGSR